MLGKIIVHFPGVGDEVESQSEATGPGWFVLVGSGHDGSLLIVDRSLIVDGQHCPFNAFCGLEMNALKECATEVYSGYLLAHHEMCELD